MSDKRSKAAQQTGVVVLARASPSERRDTGFVTNNEFTVDQARAHLQHTDSGGQNWIAIAPIAAATGEQPRLNQITLPLLSVVQDSDLRSVFREIALSAQATLVGMAAATWRLLPRRQPRIGFDPIGTGGGKPSFRSSDRRGIALTGLHMMWPL